MSKYIDLRITSNSEEDLGALLIALRKIQVCGDVGMGRTLPIHIDGDGSARFGMFTHKEPLDDKGLGELKEMVELDKDKVQEVLDGNDFETHYIGG